MEERVNLVNKFTFRADAIHPIELSLQPGLRGCIACFHDARSAAECESPAAQIIDPEDGIIGFTETY
jgi:hypothetical protein